MFVVEEENGCPPPRRSEMFLLLSWWVSWRLCSANIGELFCVWRSRCSQHANVPDSRTQTRLCGAEAKIRRGPISRRRTFVRDASLIGASLRAAHIRAARW